MKQKNKIIIVAGDPNSINSEIIFKCLKKLKKNIKKKIYIIGSYNLIKQQFKKLKYHIEIEKIKNFDSNIKNNNLKIIDIDLKFKDPFNVENKKASKYIINCLNIAHKLALKKNVSGLINCAINKKLLVKKNIGVTEYLASKCDVKNNSEVMLIRNKKISVSPITTHIDLKDVSKNINKEIIIKKIKTIHIKFYKLFYKKPKIGLLGLNPHNAELRQDSKEKKVIIPAIQILKKKSINIKGPLIPDNIFIDGYKNYDIIVGMYHDQVLAPFKALFKFNAINITLGLKYIRVSPDHGVATNLIKKNKANPLSLMECIDFINKLK
jgi:4-hydroxythreonine-4-phosphate dehydrogenase